MVSEGGKGRGEGCLGEVTSVGGVCSVFRRRGEVD